MFAGCGSVTVCQVVREPLLLEAFGPCLPSSPAGAAFKKLVLDPANLRLDTEYCG